MQEIPESYARVPVPYGVYVGSIESRLDRFSGVCIAESFAPTRESRGRIKSAWEDFTQEEKGLLRAEATLARLGRISVIEKFVNIDSVARRRAAIIQLIERTQSVRAGLMTGGILRPRTVDLVFVFVRI